MGGAETGHFDADPPDATPVSAAGGPKVPHDGV